MASNTTITITICSDCDLRKITKPSSHWCSVCEEALCSDCNDNHKLRKLTRDHSTIPIEQYYKLPECILNIKQYCQEHDEKFVMFCQAHDTPICSNCIKTHAKCAENFLPLGDIVSSAKTSEAFSDVLKRLEDLEENIKKVQNDREHNIGIIKEHRKKCEKEIRSIRQQFMEHIDRIETKLLSELSSTEDKITQSINTVIKSLKENERLIVECKATMEDMKQFASDLQTFVGVKDIESRLRKHEQVVDEMVENKALDNIDIEIMINTKVKGILEEIDTFGSIVVHRTDSSIRIVRRKDMQAQFVTEKVRNVNDINVTNAQKIFEFDSGSAICGVDIASNGEMLFACHGKGNLVVVLANGSRKFCHTTGCNAFDAKYLDNKTAVFTSGRSTLKCLSIIDFTNRKILNTISLQGEPYGLAITADFFIVAVRRIGIQTVDRSNYQTTTIVSQDFGDRSYIAALDGQVYYTDYCHSNKVTCCDMKGQSKWKFENKNVLDFPNGLAVDKHKNVYVVGQRSKNVIVISPDGSQYKQVLTENDGLKSPTVLCLDRERNKLLVANYNGAAYLYDIR